MIELDIQAKLGGFLLDAQFDVGAGVTAIYGHSGAGKTSIINAVSGLIQPDRGRIAVGDRVLFDAATGVNLPVARRRVGYVFQDARLFPHMRVQDNLHYGGSHDEVRVIEMLGLGPLLERMPRHLSGGERQRVALGRALLSDPQILLLDEPLAALDAPRKAEIMPYLERLRDTAQVPILYVTHAMSEIARLANHLVILQAGRVVRAGGVADVLADPKSVPLVGVREAGAVITAKITEIDRHDGLTTLAYQGERLVLPGQLGRLGQMVRLRIPAQDVILSRDAPQAISALNVVPVQITQIEMGHGPGVAVALRVGEGRLLARITRRSAARLKLQVGDAVFAILKATAAAPSDVGPAGVSH